MKKIAIIGAGAMGSVYGGLLGAAGCEVWLLDIWQEHIDVIRKKGITVKGASSNRRVRVHATTSPEDIGLCDLVVIATKAHDIEAALKNTPMMGPETIVLSIQNGIGNAERIEKIIGPQNLLIGIAEGFGASVVKPGEVYHHGWAMIHLGEYRAGLSKRTAQLAAVWKSAGFNIKVSKDIHSVIWGKLTRNVAFSAICTIAGLRIGQVIKNASAWQIALACAREAKDTALAKGIVLPYKDPSRWLKAFAAKIPEAKPSMLIDVEAGRKSEIDALNGAVVKEAESHGVYAPANTIMTTLVKTLEEKNRVFGQAFGVF
ncbi:MAG TPA: 2-dehydropantoate 2-reductase [Desulfobacterales bacterium]|nr:2-dehydropantoate 2-reductase [Desulfobacterales bacterium]